MVGKKSRKGIVAQNLINICVNKSGDGEIGGEVFSYYAKKPWRFENVVQLLRCMEEFYDSLSFPQAEVQFREFNEMPQPHVIEGGKVAEEEEVLSQRGLCATFYVYVQYRQNATWQGTFLWKEGGQSVEFQSALEFIMLMDNVLRVGST